MRLTGHICTHVGNLASLLKMYLIVPQVVQSSPAPTTNSTTAPVTRRADGPTQSTTGTDCARWNVTVLLLSKCISLCRKFTVTMYFTVPQVVRSSSAPMIKFMTAPVPGSKVNYEQCFYPSFQSSYNLNWRTLCHILGGKQHHCSTTHRRLLRVLFCYI